MNPYWGILIFLVISVVLPILMIGLNYLVSSHSTTEAQKTPYECGFQEFSEARLPFDIRYYIVSIVFILFDLEVIFLFPWAVSLRHTGWGGFVSMLVFLAEFFVVFCYLWSKGILDWD